MDGNSVSTSTSIAALLGSTSMEPPARALFSPREAEAILGVSHATLYRLIAAGRLDARKIDGKTVITAASIRQFIAGLPKAEVGAAA
jgi:excisionase family DNA binding protein